MKNAILLLSVVTLLSACGKKSNEVVESKGSEPILSLDVDSLVGSYDLIRMDTEDCGASIRIVKVCDGIQVRSNTLENKSFCNINKGEIATGDNRSSTTVTLQANVLKSVDLIFDQRSMPPGKVKEVLTNTLTLDSDGNLLKLRDSGAQRSSCLYQRR